MTGVIETELAYLGEQDYSGAQHLIYPASCRKETIRPTAERRLMAINDGRARHDLNFEISGFKLVNHNSKVMNYYDNNVVRENYYREVQELLINEFDAIEVIPFDHNQRSYERSSQGKSGVRNPAEFVHVDYTRDSGPMRALEILNEVQKTNLANQRLALINVWRPIVGPVRDVPLAVCDASSTVEEDYVETKIQHFSDDNLVTPSHTGYIYSLRYNPKHRWYYFSDMMPSEVLLINNWDSGAFRKTTFPPHTGFKNTKLTENILPRESIEVRTLVVFK